MTSLQVKLSIKKKLKPIGSIEPKSTHPWLVIVETNDGRREAVYGANSKQAAQYVLEGCEIAFKRMGAEITDTITQ